MALHQRITAEECIQEYEKAAHEHQNAGQTLLDGGKALGVALMAFSAEMILKAAYFRFIGFLPTQRIEMVNLHHAKADVIPLGVAPSDYHDLRFWSEALIAVHKNGLTSREHGTGRNSRSYFAVPASSIVSQDETELRRCARRLMENWSVSDRYKSVQHFADQQDMEDVLTDTSTIARLYDEGKV